MQNGIEIQVFTEDISKTDAHVIVDSINPLLRKDKRFEDAKVTHVVTKSNKCNNIIIAVFPIAKDYIGQEKQFYISLQKTYFNILSYAQKIFNASSIAIPFIPDFNSDFYYIRRSCESIIDAILQFFPVQNSLWTIKIITNQASISIMRTILMDNINLLMQNSNIIFNLTNRYS